MKQKVLLEEKAKQIHDLENDKIKLDYDQTTPIKNVSANTFSKNMFHSIDFWINEFAAKQDQ